MLVTEHESSLYRKRTDKSNIWGSDGRIELYARSTGTHDSWGGYNMDSVVRRLTPLECERLQGFPDGWTDIGEWVDTKGKLHKEADSPRYKALGNSIAIPFWFWLLRRISSQYERPATLGSLFDGIGGFPLAWERCNGRGTAIWASEIEEFPIAVTKKHFPEEDAISEKICNEKSDFWDGSQVVSTLTKNNAGGNQRMPDKKHFNCITTFSMQKTVENNFQKEGDKNETE